MKFSSRQIELAVELKALGLTWEPSVGNYVYDATGAVKPTSPFQEHVYFLLNYDCFMERVGGVERFKAIMTWLPTWTDARGILRSLGVSDKEVQEQLVYSGALVDGTELLKLYELIAWRLSKVRGESGSFPHSAAAHAS
jgi:hypothetical protein